MTGRTPTAKKKNRTREIREENKKKNVEMIQRLLENGFINKRIAEAMKRIPRELFVPEHERQYSYADYPLPIGLGQTMSAPSIIGLMLMLADIKPGMRILELGTGSGWMTALIADLVGRKGTVITVERYNSLAKRAKQCVENIEMENVVFLIGDGSCGWPDLAPYDRILVTAGIPNIPNEMKNQLKEDGIIVAPVGSKYYQDIVVYRKKGNTIDHAVPVMFVPLIGRCGFKEP